MAPWSDTEVVVTGLQGGVGALLARDVLLRGAKKVWLHHPVIEDVIDESHLETSCGLLRENDLGDGVASAFARRLRGYGVVETLGHELLDVDTLPSKALVCACDGAGPLSASAGLGEACRRSGRGFAFVHSQGFTGTVFVDSGTPNSQTLYQALRPQSTTENPVTAELTPRAAELHAAFLRSNPETRWLLAKNEKVFKNNFEALDNGANATGPSPGPFAAHVCEIAVEAIARTIGVEGKCVENAEPPLSQWTHVDALDVLDPNFNQNNSPLPKSVTSDYEPISSGAVEGTETKTTTAADADTEQIERPTQLSLVGEDVQSKLTTGRVLLAGVETEGGGTALLSLCAAGVGEIVPVDDDSGTGDDPSTHPILRIAGDLSCASPAVTCARVNATLFPDVLVETMRTDKDSSDEKWLAQVDARASPSSFSFSDSPKVISSTGAAAAMEVLRIAARNDSQ